ncbi:MAG TPA: hypothetical protein VNY27_04440 [Solirubrobacteraceae bacterium]|nr:hypothetical protein [Solirubrobacteraceae bacterium]
MGLAVPSSVFAAFSQPFVRQLTETTPGTPLQPGGVAVDSADNLWVGNGPESLSEFAPSGSFVTTLGPLLQPEPFPTAPASLAIERAERLAGHYFYFTSSHNKGGANSPSVEVFDKAGAFAGTRWGVGFDASIAVDNSAEPTAGVVYVTAGTQGGTISKFNGKGEPASFKCSADYIEANKIVGTPGGHFSEVESPTGIAVDLKGNIYTTDEEHGTQAVDEFTACGEFVRGISSEGTPGLRGNREDGGWGGRLQRLAVDPASGALAVSLVSHAGQGAVDEFDSSGRFLGQLTEAAAGHSLQHVLEMTFDSKGDLYVVDRGSGDVFAYGPGRFVPSFRLAEASERTPASAVLNGSVNPEALINPEASGLSDCHFEYVTEAAFNATGFSDLSSGGEAPCSPAAAAIPHDSVFHPVHAEVKGLLSGTTYRYRLRATIAGVLGGSAAGGVVAFTASHAPVVVSTGAGNLSSAFADLGAVINPLGSDTTYQFQYLTAAEYAANGESYAGPDTPTSVPVPAADIGSGGATGNAPESVVQHIGGLSPATTYHFRVVASNEQGTTPGPDITFTTLGLASPGLPDNRAYELVTPPNKGSAEDMFGAKEIEAYIWENRDVGQAAESGNGFALLETHAAFGSAPASLINAYVFTRGTGGWRTTSLASPSFGVQSLDVAAVDPFDLSRVAFSDGVGSNASEAGQQRVTLLGPTGGPYTTLHADAGAHIDKPGELTTIVGSSRDLSHVVLESTSHTLAPGAEAQDEGTQALYESAGAGECTLESSSCTLLNVDSEGKLLSLCGAQLGLGGSGHAIQGGTHNALSADGSRAFFTSPDPYAANKGAGCWDGKALNTPQLYTRAGGSTVEVSKPEAGVVDPSGQHFAMYVGASEDGTRVFFISEGELTKNAEGIHDPELYEYNTEQGKLTRISAGEAGNATAGVYTVPAVSADGSAVYFTASGQLTAGAPATSGQQINLYRYDTAKNSTVYVATISKRDYPQGNDSWWSRAPALPTAVALVPEASWYTTPDGRYLLFASESELTGYSTVDHSAHERHPRCPLFGMDRSEEFTGHCRVLYRYHYEPESGLGIVCVSCNPSGAPPTSNALFGHPAGYKVPIAGPVRAMSNDGSYVFFDTADPLVPQDGNGTLDVYEWHEGRVSLISSGQDNQPSFFLGASPDGSNVFFGSHARLVPADTDSAGDVYDARICTEADPCIKPPAGETALCEGDACTNPPVALIDPTPGSLTFSGAGNVLGAPVTPPAKGKPLTNVQKLAAALKACRRKPRGQRKRCESQAHRRYGKAVRARNRNAGRGR